MELDKPPPSSALPSCIVRSENYSTESSAKSSSHGRTGGATCHSTLSTPSSHRRSPLKLLLLQLVLAFLISTLPQNASASPLWYPASIEPRNIRNLPCVSKKTQETGICMFAFSCFKVNGTHLGTCIDRFYFGSCCQLPESYDPNAIANEVLVHETHPSPLRPHPTRRPTTNATLSSWNGKPTRPATTARPSTGTYTKTTTSPLITRPTVKPAASKPPTVTGGKPSTLTTPKPLTTNPNKKPPVLGDSQILITTTQSISSSTAKPTSKPTLPRPTSKPTVRPTSKPVSRPTSRPTARPTPKPGASPTIKPSQTKPSASTTPKPGTKPTPKPGVKPTAKPTQKPDAKPTANTTQKPTSRPTQAKPTQKPTQRPIIRPPPQKPVLQQQTSKPTSKPITSKPTSRPSTFKPTTSKPTPIKTTTAKTTTSKPTTPKPTTQKPSSKPTAGPSTIQTPQKPSLTEAITQTPTLTSSLVYPSVGSSATTPSTITTQSDTGTKAPSIIPETQTQLSNEIPPVKPSSPTGVQAPEAVEEDTNSIATGGSTSATSAGQVSTPGTASPATSETTLTTEGQTESSVPSVTTQEIQTTAANTTTVSPTSTSNGTDSTTTSTETPTTTELLPGTELLNMTNYREVCGRRLVPTSRIVGGAKSTFGKWPWQISLRQWRTSTYLHKCGAALLNENWAITAAHCVDNVPPGDLLLRLGEHDLSTETEPLGHLERRVQLVASHPQFDPRTFEYDLALLRFYEPVTPFAANVLPICVPEDDRSFVGSTAYVTGWGRLYEDGPLPSVLQEVRVPVINNSACEGMYRSAGYVEHIPSIFICAGWKKGGFDSCEGDSGGPMVIQRAEDMRWVLAGVISWGIGCAEPNQPGVYTRISEFRGWINQILQF